MGHDERAPPSPLGPRAAARESTRRVLPSQVYLKAVDRFNDYLISAFVTAGHIRLMLLHDVRNEDGIKNFFQEVHELYVKVLMNPFYDPKDPISSALFDARVKVLGRKYF